MITKIYFSLIFASCIALLTACEDTARTVKKPSEVDSVAIAVTVHGFYAWYSQHKELEKMDFTDTSGTHLKLDKTKLGAYLNSFEQSGFISKAYIADEKNYFERCEKIWQTEDRGDQATGFDANRIYCAQDEVSIDRLQADEVHILLHNDVAEVAKYNERMNLQLKKEKDKWLITKILCE